MTIVLVATGASHPAPRAAHVRVPAATDDEHVVGSFAIDVWRTPPFDRPDTWFVHAFALGRGSSTPAIVTVVQDPG